MWMDLDFEEQVIVVKRAYVWGQFKAPEVESLESPSAHAPTTGRLFDGVARGDAFCEGQRLTSSPAFG